MSIVLAVALPMTGGVLMAFGVWLLYRQVLPRWMRGVWKWPLGDNSSRDVVRLMGWSSLLVGAACLPTAYTEAAVEWSSSVALAALAAMLLAGAALVAWIAGYKLSLR